MTKTILLLPKFVLSKMSDESKHSENEFYYPGEITCRTTSVANSLRKQRKKRSSQLSQKPTSKQAVKETTFPDKLSDNQLTFQLSKQSAKLLSFKSIKEFIVGQKQENRRSKQSTIYMFSSSFRVSGRS